MRKLCKYSIILTLYIFFSGCISATSVDRNSENMQSFSQDSSFYISIPYDGVYGDNIYTGSGATTAQIVAAAFRRQAHRVYRGNKSEGDDCTASAKQFSATYAVCPSILHWEDRATEWSGISDKVEISITILDANDGRIISSAIIKGKSSFWTLGGDHPQDLLEEPVNEYVLSLYRGNSTTIR